MILSHCNQMLQPARRIISVVPSQTELLHYFKLEKETLAITKFCVHPAEWYCNKIRIGGTKTIDIQKIISLNPDLIIANKEENVQEQIEQLAVQFPVWLSDVNTLQEALDMIKDIGELTGSTIKADQLTAEIHNNFATLAEFISTSHFPKALSAAYFIWKNPYMTVGSDSFIADMMQKLGLKNIFAHKKRYPQVTVNDVKNAGCQLLLLSSEPYPFAEKEKEELQQQLPDTKILLVDGEMFSWYGSRLLQAPGYFSSLLKQMYNSNNLSS